MTVLFINALTLNRGAVSVVTENERIRYIGAEIPDGDFDRVIDCKNGLLMPGLYNCHTHAAMTLFRGYGEDMPLKKWLDDLILPAEDRLTDRSVYAASMLAIAEMLKNGIVSFSDMYFFCDNTARAVAETGIKANLSRSVVSFDDSADMNADNRFNEAKRLFGDWNNAANGRIRVDMAIHAEYTNVPRMVRAISDYSAAVGARMQLHLSETKSEHEKCKARRNITPAKFFATHGAFDIPCTAAHCVWVEDGDIELMKRHGVTAAHNPCSNLKLGSGVMPLAKLLANGLNITLGTDGTASNNQLDIMREMYTAAILSKGITGDTTVPRAEQVIDMATVNGAKAQGRDDCGRLEEGCRADIILIDLDAVNNIPYYTLPYSAVYSANSSNVKLTMVDGKILYENGEFPTIDIENVKYEMKEVCAHYFD